MSTMAYLCLILGLVFAILMPIYRCIDDLDDESTWFKFVALLIALVIKCPLWVFPLMYLYGNR